MVLHRYKDTHRHFIALAWHSERRLGLQVEVLLAADLHLSLKDVRRLLEALVDAARFERMDGGVERVGLDSVLNSQQRLAAILKRMIRRTTHKSRKIEEKRNTMCAHLPLDFS